MTTPSKIASSHKSLRGLLRSPTRASASGKADVVGEETGKCTLQDRRGTGPGIWGKTRRDNVGKDLLPAGADSNLQRPLGGACSRAGRRIWVWRMSQYEQGRRGNALRSGARHHSGGGNTSVGQRGSGHLAVLGYCSDTEPRETLPPKQGLAHGQTIGGKGVCGSALKPYCRGGRPMGEKPRSEPDSGKPTVRDRRGAWGNVAHGGNGNPPHNRKGGAGNPPPTGVRAPVLSRLETSLEKLDIVDAQAFMFVEGSSRALAKGRVPAPPGCVTLARAQGTGGNLGGPRASRTEPRGASNTKIGRGGAREQATRVNPVSADTGLTANKLAVSLRTKEPDRVGASEGDRSLSRRDGGVGWANSTGEVGEVVQAATRWREGADRGSRKGAMNSKLSKGDIPGTRRPT